MKKLETVYQVELTKSEVNAIVDSLHKNYIEMKNDTMTQGSRTYNENLTILQSLRNDFANLLNRSYMGADA